MSREIHVIGDWRELGQPTTMGILRSDQVRREEVFSFEYDSAWLKSHHAMPLDPGLQLFPGRQYLPQQSRPNFGLFLDSCPDRWGRLLMTRREAIDARRDNREEKRLTESDYLLGVHDEQRMGGLRFKVADDGPFLSDEAGMAAPPWTRLRELENAAWQVQSTDTVDDLQVREWLGLLLAPGSSIGGARPKAGVCDEDGALWIAKFPGRTDQHDVGAWEMVVHQLAVQAGLDVGHAALEEFGQRHRTFMSKRFDRHVKHGIRTRIHFASAMTMLGYADGTDYRDGASYLEIVEFLGQNGVNVDLAPTILNAAGIEAPATMQGRDLSPLYLAQDPPKWREAFFYEHATIRNIDFIPSSAALVRKDFKYFYWPDFQREQLFDMTADPMEEHDLAADPAQAERLAEMRDRFAELKAEAR